MPPTPLQLVTSLDVLPTAVWLPPILDMAMAGNQDFLVSAHGSLPTGKVMDLTIITTLMVVVARIVVSAVLVILEMVVASLAIMVMAQVGGVGEAVVMVEVAVMRVLESPHARQNGSTNLI